MLMRYLSYCMIFLLALVSGCSNNGNTKPRPHPAILRSAADSGTANSFSSVINDDELYGYGSNMGWFGPHFGDKDVALLAYRAGSKTIRPSLPDRLISGYDDVNIRINEFRYYYDTLGMRSITVFVGEPNDPSLYKNSGVDHRETKTFPGCDKRSSVFKGLYEPVWLDEGRTKVNPSNSFANYLYKIVTVYGAYVKYWEIMNEPDLSWEVAAWQDSSYADSWWNKDPSAQQLVNLNAPPHYYIRMLRVAWEVIKQFQPASYVCTGGFNYPSFLDFVLRNTDNPVDGSVNKEFPLRGGAYFDVLSYHIYPSFFLNAHYNKDCSCIKEDHHSDAGVDVLFEYKEKYENVLQQYGYGSVYPGKKFICTETDQSRATADKEWGDMSAANNYIIKAHVYSQVNNIRQLYKYGLGDGSDSGGELFNKMGVYSNLTDPAVTVDKAERTEQWYAVRTMTECLYGSRYDTARTAELKLPASVRGAAFKDGAGKYVYVLWARTSKDRSEEASSVYSFPFQVNGSRREWDFSKTHSENSFDQKITLTGSPSFFIEK